MSLVTMSVKSYPSDNTRRSFRLGLPKRFLFLGGKSFRRKNFFFLWCEYLLFYCIALAASSFDWYRNRRRRRHVTITRLAAAAAGGRSRKTYNGKWYYYYRLNGGADFPLGRGRAIGAAGARWQWFDGDLRVRRARFIVITAVLLLLLQFGRKTNITVAPERLFSRGGRSSRY